MIKKPNSKYKTKPMKANTSKSSAIKRETKVHVQESNFLKKHKGSKEDKIREKIKRILEKRKKLSAAAEKRFYDEKREEYKRGKQY